MIAPMMPSFSTAHSARTSSRVLTPPEAITGMRDGLRQPHRGLDVDALHHAVAADVGVDDGLHPVALEGLRQINDVVLGQFGPAVDRHPPLLGVQADDDVAGIFQAQIADEMRLLHRLGADDDELDAGIQIGSTVSSSRMPPPT
jgi:hypothetical protein